VRQETRGAVHRDAAGAAHARLQGLFTRAMKILAPRQIVGINPNLLRAARIRR
jgi:hypothetical protein